MPTPPHLIGLRTPAGSDLISTGDDDITANALALARLWDRTVTTETSTPGVIKTGGRHLLTVGPDGELPAVVFDQLDLPDAASIAAMQEVLDAYQAGQDATDAAVSALVLDDNAHTKTVLDGTYSGHDHAALLTRPLTSWGPEFRPAGGQAGSWPASTYDGWIAGIDGALVGAATKSDRGPGSDARRIYAYTAGAPAGTAPHALILGGTHPMEMPSQHAAMRFFTTFATSTAPAMRALRERVRITWVPTLTPSRYGQTRQNANGIDVNRNGDFYHRYFNDADATFAKGAAPLDQPEAQAVKTLLDSLPIACVIDCHMLDNTGTHFRHQPTSSWIAANRATSFAAMSQWAQLYNTAGVTWSQMDDGSTGLPTLPNYAARYMTHAKRRENAYAVLLEARVDAAGTTGAVTTAEFIRLYAGMIHMHLAEWLANGQRPAVPASTSWEARIVTEQASVSIADGGTLINSQNPARLAWEDYRGSVGTRTRKLDIPIRSTGVLLAEVRLLLQQDAGTEDTRVETAICSGLVPAAGGDVPAWVPSGMEIITVPPPAAGQPGRATGVLQWRVGYDNPLTVGDLVHRLQLQIRNLDPGRSVKIRNMQMFVQFYPNTEVERAPIVPSTLA